MAIAIAIANAVGRRMHLGPGPAPAPQNCGPGPGSRPGAAGGYVYVMAYSKCYATYFQDSVTKSGPLVCVPRSVSSRQYVSFKNQPKWIEDSPSRQQIIRKRSIIDRFSVYSYVYIYIYIYILESSGCLLGGPDSSG